MAVGARKIIATFTHDEKEHVMNTLADHKTRLEKCEQNDRDYQEIVDIVNKIWRLLKWGTPTIVSSLVTAGVLNSKWGAAILAALQ